MVNIVGDLNKRYGNVYIARKPKEGSSEIVPLYIESFLSGEGGNIIVRIYNQESETFSDEVFEEDNYILGCPRVGMVFDGEKAYYVRRIPDRQWKGGYNRNVIRMGVLCQSEVRELGLKTSVNTDLSIVKSVYNPEYISVDVGINSMKRGKIFSFPISRKFAIGQNHSSKFPVVFYKDWIVGWYEDENVCLPSNTQHLIEELSQYVSCRRV